MYSHLKRFNEEFEALLRGALRCFLWKEYKMQVKRCIQEDSSSMAQMMQFSEKRDTATKILDHGFKYIPTL
jgi:hypothetical protein